MEIMKQLKPGFFIVAMGSTNSGKSTIMNKLLLTQLLASSEKRETDSVYLVEFGKSKNQQFEMTMWQDDPNKVGNLIKEEKASFDNLEQAKEGLKGFKTKNFKKYKIKIPYNPKNLKINYDGCQELI